MYRLMDATEIWLRRIAYAAAAIGGAAVLLMLVLVTANIVLRPFGGTVRGVVEAGGYLCALGIGLCMPAAQMTGSHITAGLWLAALPRPARLAQQGAASLLCALLLFLVSRELFAVAEYALDTGETIEGFGISYCGMAVAFALGIGLHGALFLHAFLRLFFPAASIHPAFSGHPAARTREEA